MSIMGDILRRLRKLGPDWHKKLADEMAGKPQTNQAKPRRPNAPPRSGGSAKGKKPKK